MTEKIANLIFFTIYIALFVSFLLIITNHFGLLAKILNLAFFLLALGTVGYALGLRKNGKA